MVSPLIGAAGIGAASSLLGGLFDQRTSNRQANQQAAFQREFAQHGVRWRVADAEAAGIHPLYAMGASVPTYSPVRAGAHMGRGIAAAGQDISRAIAAHHRPEPTPYEQIIQGQTIANNQLKNDLLRAQIRKMNSAERGPGIPIEGYDDGSNPFASGDVKLKVKLPKRVNVSPVELQAAEEGSPAKAAGVVTDFQYVRTADGGLAVVPSRDVKERIEDMIIPEMQWAYRNLARQGQFHKPDPKRFPPKPGYKWEWNVWHGEWRQVKIVDSQWNRFRRGIEKIWRDQRERRMLKRTRAEVRKEFLSKPWIYHHP